MGFPQQYSAAGTPPRAGQSIKWLNEAEKGSISCSATNTNTRAEPQMAMETKVTKGSSGMFRDFEEEEKLVTEPLMECWRRTVTVSLVIYGRVGAKGTV